MMSTGMNEADLAKLKNHCINPGEEWRLFGQEAGGSEELMLFTDCIGRHRTSGIRAQASRVYASPSDMRRVLAAVNALPALLAYIDDLKADIAAMENVMAAKDIALDRRTAALETYGDPDMWPELSTDYGNVFEFLCEGSPWEIACKALADEEVQE